jgi:hypothetical protein
MARGIPKLALALGAAVVGGYFLLRDKISVGSNVLVPLDDINGGGNNPTITFESFFKPGVSVVLKVTDASDSNSIKGEIVGFQNPGEAVSMGLQYEPGLVFTAPRSSVKAL